MNEGEAIFGIWRALAPENKACFDQYFRLLADKDRRVCAIFDMVVSEEIMPENAPQLINEYLDSKH